MIEKNAKILLESASPNCPLYVVVQECKYSTYMYLLKTKAEDEEQERSYSIICTAWVRNHIEDYSNEVDLSVSQDGYSPIVPGLLCNHPQGKTSLNPEDLECIWFEDGNGAALLEKNEILCIISSWTGKNFPAYSKDCIKENSLATPLTEDNVLIKVVRKAQEFREFILTEGPLESLVDERYELLENHFGKCVNSYKIETYKPLLGRVLRFEQGDTTYLLTFSTSLVMQPTVELYSDSPEDFRRVEFGLAIKTNELNKSTEQILNFFSMIIMMPWDNISWIGHGHTTECFKVFSSNNLFPYGVFINSRKEQTLPQINFPDFRGDHVNLLWITPITQEEFNFLKDNGVEEFLKKSHLNNRSLIFGE